MEVHINPSPIMLLFFFSTIAMQRVSAFSSPPNHGATSVLLPCLSSLTVNEEVRIGKTNVNHHRSVGSSRLFADATSSVVETADAQDDAFPTDPAKTTPEFLAGLWKLIAKGNDMVKGETETVLFPEMGDKMTPRYLNLITAHLDACKDVCDYFGVVTTLQPFVEGGVVKGFTMKSYRNPDKDPNNMEWDYDPFWDDMDDFDYSGIDAEFEKEEAEAKGYEIKTAEELPEIANKIPDNDEEIEQLSKDWVAKICSDMGVCPFTSGASMAGLPIGPVYYTTDRSSSFEDMYAVYWQEVVRVAEQSEKDLSTTLLIAPEFCMDNVEIFETWSTTLTQPLSALGLEDMIQLVFFHPQWVFRDGGGRAGDGAAANYARRSPWPMINILRTNQVRAAQRGIPTGLVYKQNEKTLSSVGADKLETMLRLRDWGEIADVKVDRREIEALRVAQDYQKTGVIKQEDASFANDATPAANKVDGNQIEQGDLVNVLLEALKKRLGKSHDSVDRLTGPETSAAIMAMDFLLKELKKIVDSKEIEKS
mmetsp:Transcript_23095/g.54588  ORF Transcript_23095/g.54588 Transcript_23095/m.54588 type:complete len:535 (-) Transcript_23095:129-1733(-)